jgi:hypothetical protein
MAWASDLKSQGFPVDVWFYENAAHGILIGSMKKETRTYGTGNTANLRYGWTGSPLGVADKYASDILKLIQSSYP